MRMNLTQKQVSEMTAISLPTIYKFESGRTSDMSFTTLMKLLKVLGLGNNWEQLLPELPESPYLYKDEKKRQRIRHSHK